MLAAQTDPLASLSEIPHVRERGYLLHGINNLSRINLQDVHVGIHSVCMFQHPFDLRGYKNPLPIDLEINPSRLTWADIVKQKLLGDYDEKTALEIEEEIKSLKGSGESVGSVHFRDEEIRPNRAKALGDILMKKRAEPNLDWLVA
ncbi:hypothetical protein CC78DRAFT_575288 [Lojkania enalia]|uniref:Uncharacterized protein n=1 Tax=Lojkania enalia TaxID=147567 RepID=A0A9P4TQ24_9PLEO|nr:hypothetical protein CC78DRAFT_575288 [Didymosphaeria enalia]